MKESVYASISGNGAESRSTTTMAIGRSFHVDETEGEVRVFETFLNAVF